MPSQNSPQVASVASHSCWEHPDLLVRHGSHLFGCATPESDVDLRGFTIEPALHLIDRQIGSRFEQREVNDKTGDVVIYGVRKFFSLLEAGAPNCIELLFAPEEHLLSVTEKGRLVLDNGHFFISRRLLKQVYGFSISEWRKAQLLTKNKETGEIYVSPRVVGAQRKKSYAKYGYCTKNAYHAIRLIDEGIELMQTGRISFPRSNVDELTAIREGQIPLEKLSKRFEALTKTFREEEGRTNLPERTDRARLNRLYLDIVRDRLRELVDESEK